MGTRDDPAGQARRGIERAVRELVDDLRARRLALGLSLEVVARGAGISPSLLSRIERHLVRWPRPDHLAAVAALLGLRLRVTMYPDGEPVADRVQLRLLDAFHARLHPAIRWRTEVPLPIPGDGRAWDAVAVDPSETWTGVEGISRLGAVDATLRRANLKLRDDPRVARIVLVVADTVRNRDALRLAGSTLRADYPLDTRTVLAALGTAQSPPLNGVAIVRVPPVRPQLVHTGGKVVDGALSSPSTFVEKPVGPPESGR